MSWALSIGLHIDGEGWTSGHQSASHAHKCARARANKKRIAWYVIDDGNTVTLHVIENRNLVTGHGTKADRRARSKKLGEEQQLTFGGGAL